jgi:hypothetical protein
MVTRRILASTLQRDQIIARFPRFLEKPISGIPTELSQELQRPPSGLFHLSVL